jgi:sigma-E factor negative regulatory protein RseA
MTDEAKEHVSAMVDGELDSEDCRRLIGRLAVDPELKAHWERYHLISDTLGNHLPAQLGTGLAERVAAALEAEPTILAPRPRVLERLRPYLSQGASVAVAASVAVMAIVGLPVLVREDPAVPAAPLAQSSFADTRTPVQSRLSQYLVNHYEHGAMTRAQGVLPYVRIVGYDADQQ